MQLDLLFLNKMITKKEVSYLVRSDSLYLAYLQDKDDSNIWIWDESYRTKEEFEDLYKDFTKTPIDDED